MSGGLRVVTKDMTVDTVMVRGVEGSVALPNTVVEFMSAVVGGVEELVT